MWDAPAAVARCAAGGVATVGRTPTTERTAMAAARAAIVTGASSGIGLAIARVLGEEGYGMTIAARRPEKLEGAVEGLAADGFDVQARGRQRRRRGRDQEGRRRPPRPLRAPRRARQQRRRRHRRGGRRDRDQAPGHAARHQPALDRPLLPRMHADAQGGRRASTTTRSSSTPPRSPASAARAGCRSTRPPSTASSAGPKR